MNPKKLLIISLLLSFFAHLFFGIGLETYQRVWRLVKKPLTDRQRERVFQVIPYVPKDWVESPVPPKDAKFLGPKNYAAKQESPPPFSAPKIITPELPPAFLPKPVEKPSEKQDGAEAKTDGKLSGADTAKIIDSPKEKPPDLNKQVVSPPKKPLPSLEKLVPKTQDLLAKMPKEESLDFNRGAVKTGKELIVSTKEFKYWSYLDKMKRKIELLWQYPEVARMSGIGGVLRMDFSIAKDGKLERLAMLESSGFKFLDDAAAKAVKDAAPYAPFPDTWDIERLNIQGTFIYEIKMVR